MAFERGRAPPGSVERRRLPEIDVDQLLEDGPPSSQAGCLDQNTIPGAHETDDQGLTESGEWSTLLEDLEASEAQRKQKLRAKLLKDSEDAMSEIVPGSPDPNHSKRSSLEEPSRGDIIQDLLDNKKTVPAPLDQTSFGDDVRTDQSGSKVWQSGDTMLDKTSETDLAQDTVPSRTDSNNRASERRMWLRLCFAFLVATIMSALVVVSFASILLYWENIDGLLQAEFLGGDQRTGCKVLSRGEKAQESSAC